MGGYRVLLKLAIDPDEAYSSDHVVTVDMPLPVWGETKSTCNKATRPPRVDKSAREKCSQVLTTLKKVRAKL